jgi:predicted negative regulator of RcsB-dependent stress response
MAFDLQEQEQIESLKAFWQLWGKWIAGGVLALALAYVGYVAWGMHRAQQVSAAAQIYSAIEQSAQGQDLNGVRAGVTQIEFQYAATPYAPPRSASTRTIWCMPASS